MAKPDLFPTFIEVGALEKPYVPAESVLERAQERDWVDEFVRPRNQTQHKEGLSTATQRFSILVRVQSLG